MIVLRLGYSMNALLVFCWSAFLANFLCFSYTSKLNVLTSCIKLIKIIILVKMECKFRGKILWIGIKIDKTSYKEVLSMLLSGSPYWKHLELLREN